MSNDTNDIIQNLGEKGEKQLIEREDRIRGIYEEKQRRQRNIGSKNRKGQNREEPVKMEKDAEKRNTGDLKAAASMSFDEAIKEQDVYRHPEPDPELEIDFDKAFSYEDSDPFSELSNRMEQQVSSLATPINVKPEKPEKPRSKKLSSKSAGNIGERVTKEHAEKVISGEKSAGSKSGMRQRATIIVRTKVVDPDGNPLQEESVVQEEQRPKKPEPEKEKAPEEKRYSEKTQSSEKKVAAPKLSLVRKDTGEVYDIDRDLTIGRYDTNDICIPYPEGYYVSHKHAEIYIRGKDIFLKDIGSRNGTYVNDNKIDRVKLRAGQIVEFGDVVFEVVKR